MHMHTYKYAYIYILMQIDMSSMIWGSISGHRPVTQALQQLAAPLGLHAQLLQLRRLTPGALPEATHLLAPHWG